MARPRATLDQIGKALPYFLLGFAVFLGVGFFTGWDERERKAREKVYAKLSLVERSDGKVALQLTCVEDGQLYHFLVGPNRVVPNPAVRAVQKAGNPSEENRALRTAALAFLGGPAGAVSHKSVMDSLSKARTQPRWPYLLRLAAGILGGVSGYTLGYWQGSTWGISCGSDLGHFVLADEDHWKDAESIYFYTSVIEMELGESARIFLDSARNLNALDNDPLFECDTRFEAVAKELAEIGDPVDRDFARLVALIDIYEEAKEGREYTLVKRLNFGRVLVEDGGQPLDSALVRHYGYTPELYKSACAELDAATRRGLD